MRSSWPWLQRIQPLWMNNGVTESMRRARDIHRERWRRRIMAKEHDTLIAEMFTKADAEVKQAIVDGKATAYFSDFL